MATSASRHAPGPDISFPAIMTIAQLEVLDRAYMDWRENRRIALALLARSGRQLAEAFDKDPGRLRSLYAARQTIVDYRTHLFQAIKVTDNAMARLEQVEAYLAQNVTREISHYG